MGLVFNNAESSGLLAALDDTIGKSQGRIDDLIIKGDQLIYGLENGTLSGAGYSAAKSFFQSAIRPILSREQEAIARLMIDRDAYRNAHNAIAQYGDLDEEKLNEEKEILNEQIKEIEAHPKPGPSRPEGDPGHDSDQDYLTRQVEIRQLQEQVSEVDTKLQALRTFNTTTSSLFKEAMQSFEGASKTVTVVTKIRSTDPHGDTPEWYLRSVQTDADAVILEASLNPTDENIKKAAQVDPKKISEAGYDMLSDQLARWVSEGKEGNDKSFGYLETYFNEVGATREYEDSIVRPAVPGGTSKYLYEQIRLGMARNAGRLDAQVEILQNSPAYQQASPAERVEMLRVFDDRYTAYNDLHAITYYLDKYKFGLRNLTSDPDYPAYSPSTFHLKKGEGSASPIILQMGGRVAEEEFDLVNPSTWFNSHVEITISQTGGSATSRDDMWDTAASNAEVEARNQARRLAIDVLVTMAEVGVTVLSPEAGIVIDMAKGNLHAVVSQIKTSGKGTQATVASLLAGWEEWAKGYKEGKTILSGDAKADQKRLSMLGAGSITASVKNGKGETVISPYDLAAQEAAEVWDEAGITAYINQNPSFTMEDYERVLAEASDISASVKEYLLKGKASGLSICDMTYEQLCELRSGMDLLSNPKMPGSNSDASNNCETYYQQMGNKRVGHY